MVRRDETDSVTAQVDRPSASRCAFPAGASPVPASVGAPGSRPQRSGRDSGRRAGRQEPAMRQKPSNGEQARGPQHEVKPAASTDQQSEGRADHVAAKATPTAQAPKRAFGLGGVEGAVRVHGEARNTRGPSAWPTSGRGAPNKPK